MTFPLPPKYVALGDWREGATGTLEILNRGDRGATPRTADVGPNDHWARSRSCDGHYRPNYGAITSTPKSNKSSRTRPSTSSTMARTVARSCPAGSSTTQSR